MRVPLEVEVELELRAGAEDQLKTELQLGVEVQFWSGVQVWVGVEVFQLSVEAELELRTALTRSEVLAIEEDQLEAYAKAGAALEARRAEK
ncbi:hypothetical protein ENH_00024840 [Eimeria necatrix]|uniref:Uncharacterized protein n=1 Tax=Eimeria necatrix TaxID=51315 RepID=U6MM66_9EIME|nr:hypothetical protein ENH_00024840 [Eimeria necatrix]CDJ62750.1 hypothetical protein ENH_00024840 [Eimeria necatrix]